MAQRGTPPPLVIMGVSGTGKTSIGRLLAAALDLDFVDGDDLHSAASKSKMRAGIPLDDVDRWPWLDAVARRLGTDPAPIIACSALKRSYRDRVRVQVPGTVFIHLTGPRETIVSHLAGRTHEFMSPGLIDSQLSTLEPLGTEEPHLLAPIDLPPQLVCDRILEDLGDAVANRAPGEEPTPLKDVDR